MRRRSFLASLLLSPAVVNAHSQALQLMIPFPPGGGGDVLARAAAIGLAGKLGQTIWCANRPGASGTIGARAVAKRKPDGGTIGYVTNGILCVNRYLQPETDFDPDVLMPVGMISRLGLILVANDKAFPQCRSLDSLVDWIYQMPDEVCFASAGVGTTSHLAAVLFAQSFGLKLRHIPFAGGAAAMTDVLAGRIPFMLDVASNALPHAKSGALRALATTSEKPLPAAPEIPSFSQLGVPSCSLCAWDGLVLPPNSSATTRDRLSKALAGLRGDAQAVGLIRNTGAEAAYCGYEEFAAFIEQEKPKWKRLALLARLGEPSA